MALRIFFQLIVGLLCVSILVLAEERLGLKGILDGTLTNSDPSYTSPVPPTYQTHLNGQFVLLGSLRLRNDLFAFYEGRINHSEGLSGSHPRLQQTRTNSVIQGYLHYSPQMPWDLNLQMGKFGNPFGQFLTRNYANENPLIGFPLLYTHRTPVRSNQLPKSPSDLISLRGQAQREQSYNGRSDAVWLPLINFSYPTGLMAFGSPQQFDYRFALINSSLANPMDLGHPGQRIQWVAGGGWTCIPGLRFGASYAQGAYLDPSVNPWLPIGTFIGDYKQRALGFDLQYFIGHLEFYGEVLFNNFKVPNIQQRLGATGYYLELKHTWTPRFFSAVRWNQIYFDRLRSGFSDASRPRFDYNVNSLELGMGYRFTEKLLSKASYQFNRTLAGYDPEDNVFAAQLVYTFDIRNLLRTK